MDQTAEKRIRDSFSRQGLMAHLGARMHEVADGQVTIRMPYDATLTQQHGYFHAGGVSAIADSAGGYAGMTRFGPDREVLTVEFKINLINPAQGDYVEAVGKVIKSGRTLTICALDVFAVTGAARVHVATGMQTLISVPNSR